MQSFHTTCDDADALGREVPPALTTSGCEPGSSTASEVGGPGWGPGSSPRSRRRPTPRRWSAPAAAMRSKIPFSVWRKAASVLWMLASQSPQLVVTTWALSSTAMRLNRSSGRDVGAVRRLVDGEGRRGRAEGRQLDVERGLAPAGGRAAGPTVDGHVVDLIGQPVAGLEGGDVARQVLLELHDRDGLSQPRPALVEELVLTEDAGQLRRGVAAGMRQRRVGGTGAGLGRAAGDRVAPAAGGGRRRGGRGVRRRCRCRCRAGAWSAP